MTERYTDREKERYRSYLRIHLKKDEVDLPADEQIRKLKKKDRNKWWHVAINIAALLVFAYSFYFDLTQLSDTFFIIICVVFMVNVVLIFYQKKQLNDLVGYLED